MKHPISPVDVVSSCRIRYLPKKKKRKISTKKAYMYMKSLTCPVCKANFVTIYKIIVWPLRFILRIATTSKMIKLK